MAKDFAKSYEQKHWELDVANYERLKQSIAWANKALSNPNISEVLRGHLLTHLARSQEWLKQLEDQYGKLLKE